MKLSVFFTPLALTSDLVRGKSVLVIDVLRATTTIVQALQNGAKSVVPAESPDEAIRIAQGLERDSTRLIGEKGLKPIEGFALGNSPLEMTSKAVGGMTLVMSTTNGTPAFSNLDSANTVIVAAATNFTVAAEAAREAVGESDELMIVCAGRGRRFALEDAYTAGRFVQAMTAGRARGEVEVSDAGIAARELVRRYGDKWRRAFNASAAARDLVAVGMKADINAATEFDSASVVPIYSDKLIRARD